MKEKYKEWKLHQNIIVNLIIQQPQEGQLPYNNVKNNVPLLNGFEIALSFGFMVVICAVLLILNMTTNCTKYFYQKFVYREFAMMFFYNIIYPVIYLIKKKDMRKYVWEYVMILCCNKMQWSRNSDSFCYSFMFGPDIFSNISMKNSCKFESTLVNSILMALLTISVSAYTFYWQQ